jgi:hypothetical protein
MKVRLPWSSVAQHLPSMPKALGSKKNECKKSIMNKILRTMWTDKAGLERGR